MSSKEASPLLLPDQHLAPLPDRQQPILPNAPEAEDGTKVVEPPVEPPVECLNETFALNEPTWCEQFVYMIPRNKTNNKTNGGWESTNPCLPNPCEHGGTCHAFDNVDQQYYSCICPTGYEGNNCEIMKGEFT